MSTPEQMQQQIENVRKSAIEIIDQQLERAEDLELPAQPPTLAPARKKLEENNYRVLVVGEAKRGKSSFVNALIGRAILPVNWDIATSQVFCIRQAEREDYRVRFEDGSATSILLGDLDKYGSQKYIDMHEAPTLKDTVRWIEADVPIHFLPKGVSILDTPGVGGLYREHAEITERFIPEADGVIFTLDPTAPITQHELEFLDEILRHTPNVFFIMTKADNFAEDVVENLIRRNIEILQHRFGDRLRGLRIWPISSKNLLESVSSPNANILLAASGYRELALALRAFLFRAAGCSRAALALSLSRQYQATGAQVLLSRRANVKQQDEAQQRALRQQQQEKAALFESSWGQNGDKFKTLMSGIKREVRIALQALNQQFSVTGDLARSFDSRIKSVSSIDEANELGKEISSAIPREASRFWRERCELAQQRCIDLLGPFLQDCDSLLPEIPDEEAASNLPSPECKASMLELLRNSASYGLVTMSVLSIVGILATPLVAVVSIVMFFGGWRLSKEHQLNQARTSLRQHLGEVILSIRKVYLEVDQQQSRQSIAEDYFGNLEQTTMEQVLSLAKTKSEEARAELHRLDEAMKLDQTHRRQEYERLTLHIGSWDQISKRQEELSRQINELVAQIDCTPAAAV